jgi:N-acetylneuraminic acid mutarotase
MLVFGGHNPQVHSNFIANVKNTLFQYDPETTIWTQIESPKNRFPFRTEHSSIVWNDSMYTFFGYSGMEGYTSYVFTINLKTFEHQEIPNVGDFPKPRSACTVCLYKNKVYLFGGWDGINSNNDFYTFDLKTKIWNKAECYGKTPSPRRSHCCTVRGSYMYIFGGYDGVKNVDPVLHRFDFKKKIWEIEETKGIPPCGRSRASLCPFPGGFFIFGGWDRQKYFSDWHEFRFDTKTWVTNPMSFPKNGIGQHSSTLFQNKVLVFGGYQGDTQQSSNALWGYSLGHLGKNLNTR